MPLFISNSEAAAAVAVAEPAKHRGMTANAGMVALLAGLVLLLLGLEVTAPVILAHLSHTEQRIAVELKAAQKLQPTTKDGRPTVLFVGNSLLLQGVAIDLLHS